MSSTTSSQQVARHDCLAMIHRNRSGTFCNHTYADTHPRAARRTSLLSLASAHGQEHTRALRQQLQQEH